MRSDALVVLLVLTCCESAVAQSAPNGYIQGLAGVATAAETDRVFGVGIALRARDRIDVSFELGRLENAIWNELRDELGSSESRIRADIERLFGAATPVAFDAKVPLWYGFGGGRVRGPRVKALTTFVEAGAGLARLRPRVHLEIGGERLDVEARSLLALEDTRAELLTVAGGGVSMMIRRRFRIEAAYRYSRVHGDAPIDINRIHTGFGYAF